MIRGSPAIQVVDQGLDIRLCQRCGWLPVWCRRARLWHARRRVGHATPRVGVGSGTDGDTEVVAEN